jgi:quercetin dioxygenase-like cupin family protein
MTHPLSAHMKKKTKIKKKKKKKKKNLRVSVVLCRAGDVMQDHIHAGHMHYN